LQSTALKKMGKAEDFCDEAGIVDEDPEELTRHSTRKL
jgi:hypothetical protein